MSFVLSETFNMNKYKCKNTGELQNSLFPLSRSLHIFKTAGPCLAETFWHICSKKHLCWLESDRALPDLSAQWTVIRARENFLRPFSY